MAMVVCVWERRLTSGQDKQGGSVNESMKTLWPVRRTKRMRWFLIRSSQNRSNYLAISESQVHIPNELLFRCSM